MPPLTSVNCASWLLFSWEPRNSTWLWRLLVFAGRPLDTSSWCLKWLFWFPFFLGSGPCYTTTPFLLIFSTIFLLSVLQFTEPADSLTPWLFSPCIVFVIEISKVKVCSFRAFTFTIVARVGCLRFIVQIVLLLCHLLFHLLCHWRSVWCRSHWHIS